jgi:hypothetical protein
MPLRTRCACVHASEEQASNSDIRFHSFSRCLVSECALHVWDSRIANSARSCYGATGSFAICDEHNAPSSPSVCWLRFDCFTSHLRLPIEVTPMIDSSESAAKSRNLRFDLDRELSEWLARLEHATDHSDAVQLAKLGTRYSLDPGEACGRGATFIRHVTPDYGWIWTTGNGVHSVTNGTWWP